MKHAILYGALLLSTALLLRSQPQILAVVNSASFESGLPSGGGLATVFCSFPGGTGSPGTYLPSSSSPLPSTLAGNGVSVNGVDAPILAVVETQSNGTLYAQVNFQVPMERNVSLPNAGAYAGQLVACGATIQPLPARPLGGFFSDAKGYAIAQHASDYSLVTPQNPAHPGESIIGYANDAFPVWPPAPVGFPTPSQPLFQQTVGLFDQGYLYLQSSIPPSTSPPPFGGSQQPNTLALVTTFSGMAPGMVGVQQINFVIPANQPLGTWSLFFNNGCGLVSSGPHGCANFPVSGPAVLFPVQ
jgi:uncharacterized protein (TIGR03437 family)